VIDLGHQPPSNAYLTREQLSLPEVTYPLRVYVCTGCWLVQLPAHAAADELFTTDYAYFSSTSTSWLAHARSYFDHVKQLLDLGPLSHVVEIGSNDGYLLKNFLESGIPCLGIEPTVSTAAVAESIGIPVVREFFGYELASRLVADGARADLMVVNNVYAHVPDINDFTRGLAELLQPQGVVTLEFPHLRQLIENNQFDTIYHEHYSYLSLGVVQRIFAMVGLRVWDVEEIPTHGGSLRVYGCHVDAKHPTSHRVTELINGEKSGGLERLETYSSLQLRANQIKNDLSHFLIEQKRLGKSVAAYGAAAKGNTLLNYAGVKPDLLQYVCDAAESKQNKFLPGSHIPIVRPDAMRVEPPDWVLILPWNIADEVHAKLRDISVGPINCVTAIPTLRETCSSH
jgi:hypothetical protein